MKYILLFTGIIIGYASYCKSQNTHINYLNRGREYFEKGQYDFAIYDFEKALQDNAELEGYYWRGLCHYHLKNYKQALADFDTLLSKNPHFTQAYLQRGKIHIRFQNYNQALADLDKAAKLDSLNPDLLNERVIIYHALGRYKEASTDIKTLIKLRPNYFENYINLAGLQLQMKNYKEAITNYTKGLELMLAEKNSEDEDAYFGRATAFFELGDTLQACQDWNRAHALGHPDAASKIQQFCLSTAKK
ncbi:MAG: tetratricopeptide repeat protein [Bacteroidia bacterium]|nr:tetratricopeptide repeat protein [Bacteroidia bacterium]